MLLGAEPENIRDPISGHQILFHLYTHLTGIVRFFCTARLQVHSHFPGSINRKRVDLTGLQFNILPELRITVCRKVDSPKRFCAISQMQY